MTRVAVLPWQESARFCGESRAQVTHVFTFAQMRAWTTSAPDHTFVMACGAAFRPDWAGTTAIGPICPDCRERIAERVQTVEVPE